MKNKLRKTSEQFNRNIFVNRRRLNGHKKSCVANWNLLSLSLRHRRKLLREQRSFSRSQVSSKLARELKEFAARGVAMRASARNEKNAGFREGEPQSIEKVSGARGTANFAGKGDCGNGISAETNMARRESWTWLSERTGIFLKWQLWKSEIYPVWQWETGSRAIGNFVLRICINCVAEVFARIVRSMRPIYRYIYFLSATVYFIKNMAVIKKKTILLRTNEIYKGLDCPYNFYSQQIFS